MKNKQSKKPTPVTIEAKDGNIVTTNSPDAQPAKKTKGVVIMALRHNVYSRYACNLGLSLTQGYQELYKKGEEISICFVHDQGRIDELSLEQRFIFNRKKLLSDEQCENPFLAKLHLYNISPFDETLYLDADTILRPNVKIRDIFNQFKDVDFTIANRGLLTRDYDWCDKDKLKEAAGGEVYDVASEFIYFKKTETVKELFEQAAAFYISNDIVNRMIGGFPPDEPAFAYAMAKSGIKPHTVPFSPTFWEGNYRGRAWNRDDVNSKDILSVGGLEQSKKIADIYNGMVKYYSSASKIDGYPYQTKKDMIKERVLL